MTVVSVSKGKGHALTLIARELALELGRCEYTPDVVEHIPGVANVIADNLSRRYDPAKSVGWVIPALLRQVPENTLQTRTRQWWRSLCPMAE